MAIDEERVFKSVIKEGKVVIGLKKTKKAIMEKVAKMVVVAANCPKKKEIEEMADQNDVPVYQYRRKGTELGAACGKPFAISAFAIIDSGRTDIQKLIEER